jgi:hypothetical protein
VSFTRFACPHHQNSVISNYNWYKMAKVKLELDGLDPDVLFSNVISSGPVPD